MQDLKFSICGVLYTLRWIEHLSKALLSDSFLCRGLKRMYPHLLVRPLNGERFSQSSILVIMADTECAQIGSNDHVSNCTELTTGQVECGRLKSGRLQTL